VLSSCYVFLARKIRERSRGLGGDVEQLGHSTTDKKGELVKQPGRIEYIPRNIALLRATEEGKKTKNHGGIRRAQTKRGCGKVGWFPEEREEKKEHNACRHDDLRKILREGGDVAFRPLPVAPEKKITSKGNVWQAGGTLRDTTPRKKQACRK